MLGSCSVKQIKQQEYDQSLTEEKQLRVDTNQDSSNYRAAQQYPSKLSPGQQAIETENLSGTSGKALTDQEQAALLEGKLDASLREFDDMLLKKNQGMSDSTHTETTTGENITINQGDRSESSSPEYSGETTEDNSDSGQTITGTKRYAQEYDNDDVVARQIREAAEKETDPELKKKLWVEYKRYKSGSN